MATDTVQGKQNMDGAAGAGDAIARAFVDARQTARGLPEYPGTMPATLDDAYRIQARAIALDGRTVAGWKVGRIPDDLVARFGNNRLAGPIFADTIVDAAGGVPEMPMFAEGFGAAEAEYLLRLGSLPASFDRAWTNAEAAAHVDQIRIGIEVASSPFPGINGYGPAITVSDFGNNNGLVLGEILSRESDLLGWPVALTIDGEVAGQAAAAAMLDGPFGAVRFLFELAGAGVLDLAPGQWVSTGAVTGVHPVRPGAAVEARFGEDHVVRCTIVEARGR